MKLAFIGGGNMAQAMIAGLQTQQFTMTNISVVELDCKKHAHLQQTFGVKATSKLIDIAQCDAIVLAVKPQQLRALANDLASTLSQQLVISIAAGIRLKDLSVWLGDYATIVRAMPNIPAQIQAGITGLYALPGVSTEQIAIADKVLSSAGSTLWVDSEGELDAVTAISGSGPAYVFYFIEALEAAALALGLNEKDAKQLSLATFKGASLLAVANDHPVSKLRKQVTSKGGTTEQGILSLENSKVKEALMLAAKQAYIRSQSLGDELSKSH
ncbi:MAG: pyrroline-5-carboxylate reductase [Methylophilaceae bacterium]